MPQSINSFNFSPLMQYGRKIILSVGSFFFGFQSKAANSFHSKLIDSSGVRTAWFWSGSSRARVCIVPNILRRRIVTPLPSTPLIHKSFRYQDFSETQNGSPTMMFGTVRQKIVYRKSCYHPAFTENRDIPRMQKIYRYPKIYQTEKGPLRSFSVKWYNNLSDREL